VYYTELHYHPQAYSHLALIETAIKISKGNITSDGKIIEKLIG
jgi:hypothetical protein